MSCGCLQLPKRVRPTVTEIREQVEAQRQAWDVSKLAVPSASSGAWLSQREAEAVAHGPVRKAQGIFSRVTDSEPQAYQVRGSRPKASP